MLQVAFHLPARIKNMPHREPVLKITDTSDGTFVACSQDGVVSFWSGHIEHKRTKNVIVSTGYIEDKRTKSVILSVIVNIVVSAKSDVITGVGAIIGVNK